MKNSRACTHINTQERCESIRKDAAPCQSEPHRDLDGYRIAHSPVDKLHASRADRKKSESIATWPGRRVPTMV